MAKKIVIGKTPEQLEREEAEFIRRREAEAQERNQEQERNLRLLVAKNKRNKTIVIGVIIIIVLALLVFGTYNTFIRHELNDTDVKNIIAQDVVIFPSEGIHGFIRANFETWYNKNLRYNYQGNASIDYVKPLLDSLTIDKIDTKSRTLIRVYFSIDIECKQADYKDSLGTTLTGKTTVTRSSFFIPIEWHYTFNDAGTQVIKQGYAAVGNLSYFMLESNDSSEIYDNNAFLAFSGEEVAEDQATAARIKVDKIIRDLYAGADTSQDYIVPRKFSNPNEDIYIGIDSFKMYETANYLGYNTIITYTVQTKDGFYYSNTVYLAVKQNGSTWTIAGWM